MGKVGTPLTSLVKKLTDPAGEVVELMPDPLNLGGTTRNDPGGQITRRKAISRKRKGADRSHETAGKSVRKQDRDQGRGHHERERQQGQHPRLRG
jgi:hypothetical protein